MAAGGLFRVEELVVKMGDCCYVMELIGRTSSKKSVSNEDRQQVYTPAKSNRMRTAVEEGSLKHDRGYRTNKGLDGV
ncbi:conserved leucine-rich repeat protein [Aspergillus luchuensis]|uniref:Conserved leucine-rich repeat protein n=1 Tax=Aspergillus kawachii TaxID=1069201 RepID=A0A146FA87_ASPKA|nr:conserved leucine-rich repeat protein [Aspergillus luchuensis]